MAPKSNDNVSAPLRCVSGQGRAWAVAWVALLVAGCGVLGLSKRENWPGVAYTEVRAYVYNAGQAGYAPILVEGGRLNPSVENPEGVLLTPKQLDKLLDAVARPHSPPHVVAACFYPHHAFVFYNQGKPVAEVLICFTCRTSSSNPPLSHSFDFEALEKLVREMGLPVATAGSEFEAWKRTNPRKPQGR